MPNESWHLDKKVPIGIIVALFVQTITLVAVGVSWKSDVDHRLESLEITDRGRADHEKRLIVLEQEIPYIRQSLARIEAAITEARRDMETRRNQAP